MRSIQVREAGRYEGRYLRRAPIEKGMLKGVMFVVMQLDDGEAIGFAVGQSLAGILDAIDRAQRANPNDAVRVVIEVEETDASPKSACRVSWAVSHYPKGSPPPAWEWSRFHGN